MKKLIISVSLILLMTSVLNAQERKSIIYPFSLYYNPQRTVLRSVPNPKGYQRYPMNKMTTFMGWITNLPLKDKNTPAALWNKQIVFRADSINGVVDLGITTKNQQNADIPLQMVMEYLNSRGDLFKFPIIIGDADTVSYDKWLNGKYSRKHSGDLIYKKGDRRDTSLKEFYRFLEFVISRNENKTLLQNLVAVDEKDIAPGDLFILFFENDLDSIGHATMILDVCNNADNELLLIAAWGGVPAQSFVVYRPWPVNKRRWFTIAELRQQLFKHGVGRFYRFANIAKAFE